MKKTIIYMCACAISGLMLATSCQESMEMENPNSKTRAVAIDKDLFAVRGRINVKLEKDTNQALPTSAKGNVEMQSVPSAMASAMKYAGAYKMERVFKPAGIYEKRTIAEGLDRWYTIYFDESKDVAEVLQQFNKAAGVEYAERVLPIARPKFTAKPYTGPAPQTRNQPTASAFNDPLLAKQWHYYNDGSVSPHAKKGADCNLKPVWEKYTTGKSNVIVAVVDGGIDITHEDLVDNLYINEKEKNGQAGVDDDGNGFVDDVYGYNFVEAKDVVGGTIQPDNDGHGTHVAGTVAARNNNGKGVAGVAGGNGTPDSGVRLMSCQIFRGKDEQGDAAAAIKYAADNGAVICQNSWGYSSTSGVTAMPKLLKEAVDYFIKMAGCDENGQQRANSPMKGGVVVFAAGNENKEFAAYPACYPPAVSVSAMAWNFAKASFSNYARWITIMAPGGDQDTFGTEGGILSTVPKSKVPSGYAYFQGTSMACPHVSGIAALIASYFGRQGFTNDELKSRLITAYRPFNIDELNPAYKGKLGKGYIDAEAAFESDTKIAPEKVGTLTLTPDFVDITAEWSIAKDEDKTAAFYRLYISPNDLTAENIKDMSFKEINGMGHSLGEKLRFTFNNLQDNKAYSIAVVAVDRWGNLSEPAIQKCTTKLNHAPEVTNFPEEVIELNNNERKTFSFNVADPDGHNWDIRAIGETKGVSYSINQATVTVSIVPVLQAGSYTCTFVLTDDLGAKSEKSFTFKVIPYMPPKLEQPFAHYIIGLDEGPLNISLKGHYTGSGNQLSYKANVANGGIASVQVSNDQLQIKPLARGVTRVSVLASDGHQTSSDGSFQIRVVERKSAPVYAVYPIPAKKDINALLNPEVTQAEFVISSTVGEQLMSATVTPDKNNVAKLDLSKLRPGTYKLTVHTSKGNHTQMFIKR
ncbi:S8 family serine peptidase [Prevotella sp. oral taxon 317]|uniref:S8 family serine peptidase n=1 Tax=Prevotella sp. oral taxon 317 TaxID=652721 RepID=UPI0005C6331E|nr:S8 family serine peptidase [Prevotella sp. oral taxon 317]